MDAYASPQDLGELDMSKVSLAVQKIMLPGVTTTPAEVYESIAPAVATAAKQYTHVAPKIDWAIDHWPLFVAGAFAVKIGVGLFAFWLFTKIIAPQLRRY